MNLVKTLTSTLGLLTLMLFVGVVSVEAKSFTYDFYDVDIVVNRDSTLDITEKLGYVFDGSFEAVTRGIQINNPDVRRACSLSGGLTCGGFEFITVTEVLDEEGRALPKSAYTVGVQEYEDETSYFVVDWVFGRKNFNGREVFPVTIKYKVYGGVQFVGDNPYLYWNVLPREKGGRVENSTVTISLPEEITSTDRLEVFGGVRATTSQRGNLLTLKSTTIPSTADYTVSYKMLESAITPMARLRIAGTPWGQNIRIDGVDFGQADINLNSFPAGDHEITGSFRGYEDKTVNVNLPPGELTQVNLDLEATTGTQLLLWLNALAALIGCLLIPLGPIAAYMVWRTKGRDRDKIDTIYPIFEPPTGMRPYLVGSLIDEKVDARDISGTIIDLAYRGHLKIKEIKEGKEYELIRTESSEDQLNDIELYLLKSLFGSKDKISTKSKNPGFARKYQNLKDKVYKAMVNAGFFTVSPQTTRANYAGCSVGIMALAVATIIFMLFLGVFIFGYPGPFTIGFPIFLFGLVMIFVSGYMPAKTSFGSEVHNQVAGFKMYLETAEKYRLQELGPEEFEKYLSYAVVFGVEEQWAEKFKDIYDQPPEWYESNSPDLFSTYWLTRSLHSFSNNMNSSMFTPVSSSGGAYGSGWSGGGGSFGGFAGGGGGGGFSGAR